MLRSSDPWMSVASAMVKCRAIAKVTDAGTHIIHGGTYSFQPKAPYLEYMLPLKRLCVYNENATVTIRYLLAQDHSLITTSRLVSYHCCSIALSRPKMESDADYRADSYPRNGTTSPDIRGESVSCQLSSIFNCFLLPRCILLLYFIL